jgi:16S rRNA (guanine966-N2)-methyltransferase
VNVPRGKVRILGGELRGSVLRVGDAPGLRPTPGRVRETLFNWLQPLLHGARCLDLFAGTGALGMEALSRGAGEVTFVERDAAAMRTLQANLQRLGQEDRARVLHADALGFLDGPSRAHEVVFMDPPFDAGLWEAAAQRLEDGGWLAADARIHVEWPDHRTPVMPANWQLYREDRAGAVRHALFRRRGAIG